MLVEIVLVILVILSAIVIYRAAKKLLPLILNSIGALILLWILNILGLGVAINIWSIVIVAIGGFVGLLLVVLLHLLGIAF
jgi:hypothetical protein